jgi:Dolichyl-phosphate-mannose-protein mannosyltransferase
MLSVFWPNLPAGGAMNTSRMDEFIERDPLALGVPSQNKVLSSSATFPSHAKFLFLFFLLTLPLLNPWVRGDGVGYYAYLQSTLIDHNLRFENNWLAGNQSFIMSRVDANGHLLPEMYTSTGYVENHFTVGPAILWAPVVVPVHLGVLLLDRLGARIPADGYSRPYIVSMALTTAIYGFLSILLAFLVARKYFEQRWAFFASGGVWLASSLPVYMYFNPSWSHALSAFMVALFLWYWERTQLRRTFPQWMILGAIAGMMGNVYYPNVFLLIFPVMEVLSMLVSSHRQTDSRVMDVGKPARNCMAFAAVFFISLLPTFITRQIIYGSPFATGYPGIGTWNWGSPALLKVLFSSDHGMWSWTPILFLATMGLFFLVRRDFLLGAGSILTVLAYYYFIASYPDWDGLSSYGNRFFVSLTPIFILGLTALLSGFSRWIGQPSRAAAVSGTAIVLLVLWNAGFIFQWGTHLVPARGPISWRDMVQNQFTAVPARVTHSLETYFLHRKEMMQHIEQEDIEQQKTKGTREE